jgi:hypothetical protein
MLVCVLELQYTFPPLLYIMIQFHHTQVVQTVCVHCNVLRQAWNKGNEASEGSEHSAPLESSNICKKLCRFLCLEFLRAS